MYGLLQGSLYDGLGETSPHCFISVWEPQEVRQWHMCRHRRSWPVTTAGGERRFPANSRNRRDNLAQDAKKEWFNESTIPDEHNFKGKNSFVYSFSEMINITSGPEKQKLLKITMQIFVFTTWLYYNQHTCSEFNIKQQKVYEGYVNCLWENNKLPF